MKKRKDLWMYTVKTCKTLHECCLCGRQITKGNSYHDGGEGRRAHVTCVANMHICRIAAAAARKEQG